MYRLVKLAEEKNVSLVRLAWQTKIRTEDLKKIIDGEAELPHIWAVRIAAVFGVSVDELSTKAEIPSDKEIEVIRLNKLTLKQLREMAKVERLPGYFGMKKNQLVDALIK